MYITIIYLTNLVCTMTEDAQESRLGGGGGCFSTPHFSRGVSYSTCSFEYYT